MSTIGERLHEVIAGEVHIETTGWAADRVRDAYARLERAHPERNARAFLVWHPQPTAFTAPGRYVYVSRELLVRGLSEGGTAFAIAHEIAHHELGHYHAFEEALERAPPGAIGELVALIANAVSSVRRGPRAEIDADVFALEWCVAAGYAPDAAIEVLELLSRWYLDQRASEEVFTDDSEGRGLIDALADELRSHPPIEERLRALRARMLRPEHAPRVEPRPSGGRTGLTFVCPACAKRFAAVATCPSCAGPVVDLQSSARERTLALRELRRRRANASLLAGKGPLAIAAVSGATAAAVAISAGAGLGAAVALAAAALGGMWIFAFIARDIHAHDRIPFRVRRQLAVPELELVSIAATDEPSPVGVVRGVVHVVSPVTSPVGHVECAAFRVTGRGPAGDLDEAGAGELVVTTATGETVRIEPGDTVVELATPTPDAVAVDEALLGFLRARGEVPRDFSVATLAEAVVREGEEIEVEGPMADVTVPSGYRGAKIARTVPAMRRQPVRLRKRS